MKKQVAPITVYPNPNKPSSVNVYHPSYGRLHGKVAPEGSIWPRDSFTLRLINDGTLTTEAPAKTPVADAKSSKPSA